MKVESYLFFEGRTEEAIAFYQEVLGAKLQMLMRFSENPDHCGEEAGPNSQVTPEMMNKVMHAGFTIGDSLVMASDGNCSGNANFGGFGLSLTADSDAAAEKLFAALSEGGTVQMPMGETFFASRFGMVTDKFGVTWMVITEKAA